MKKSKLLYLSGIISGLLMSNPSYACSLEVGYNLPKDLSFAYLCESIDGYYIVYKKQNDKKLYGLVNGQGKVIINAEYDSIGRFYSRNDEVLPFADVEKDGKYGVINLNGQVIIPIVYDSVSASSVFNFIHVRKSNKEGYYNDKAQLIIPVLYDSLSILTKSSDKNHDDDQAIVGAKLNGLWGLLNSKGQVIHPFTLEFDDIGELKNGMATVSKNGKYGRINDKGDIIVPLEYDYILSFYSDVAVVQKDGKSGTINERGDVQIPIKFDSINYDFGYFDYGQVSLNDKVGVYHKYGQQIVPVKFDYIKQITDYQQDIDNWKQYFIVFNSNAKGKREVGMYDNTGNQVVPLGKYESIGSRMADNRISVKNGDNFGYVDAKGTPVIPAMYAMANVFNDERAVVRKHNGEWLLINTDNKVMATFSKDYEDISKFEFGYSKAKKNGKWGYIDLEGNVIVPFEYEQLFDVQIDANNQYNKDGSVSNNPDSYKLKFYTLEEQQGQRILIKEIIKSRKVNE